MTDDTHTLHSAITTGSIDDPDLGEFDIRDGELEVDDYDDAVTLVGRYGYLYWPGTAPGETDDDGIEPDDGETESDGGDGDESGGGFDADEWLDHDFEDRVSAVESGNVDDYLDAIEDADRSTNVLDAVEERRDALEG